VSEWEEWFIKFLHEERERRKIPRIYTRTSLATKIIEGSKRREYFLRGLFGSLRLLKPLSFLKSVSVKDLSITGYRASFRDAYVCEIGDELRLTAFYKSNSPIPVTADTIHRVDRVEEKITVLYMPFGEFKIEIPYKVPSPVNISQWAGLIRWGRIKIDESSKSYPIAIPEYRIKPMEEYPVPDVHNAILPPEFSWVWNPPPTFYEPFFWIIEEHLPMSVSVSFSGFIEYRGRLYKDPGVNNRITLSWVITNRTDRPATIGHDGLFIYVWYPDMRAISGVEADVSFPTTVIPPEQSRSFSISANIPEWAYGRIEVIESLSYEYEYVAEKARGKGVGVGLRCQFECGRLRLP